MPIERFAVCTRKSPESPRSPEWRVIAASTLWPRSAIVLPDGICWNNYAAWQSGDARRNSSAKLFKRRAAAILPECTATWERVHLFPRCNLWWIRRISYSSGWMPLWRMGTTKRQRHNNRNYHGNSRGPSLLFSTDLSGVEPANFTLSPPCFSPFLADHFEEQVARSFSNNFS